MQTEDFDAGAEIARIRAGNGAVGAVAAFIGVARDVSQGRAVASMRLEHYPGMTERALEQICEQARARWRLIDLVVVHRVGELVPTDQVVLVVAASAHRGDAFAACEFVMDYLKTEAPLWKNEATPQGAHWVEARAADAAALARWQGEP